jgi:hypothetical protein
LTDSEGTSCIQDIESSISDFINAFEEWENQSYDSSVSYLKNGLINTVDILSGACSYAQQSWWSDIMSACKAAISYFDPEIIAAYKIIVNGVNIYDDFSDMMNSCSDEVADYVTCGADLGNIVCIVH